MDDRNNNLRQFGDFRLDPEKRVLWHRGEPVELALKEIELLCVLTEHSGEVVTKAELLDRVWRDSFVDESNLSRHIYVIRKTFKELGADDDLIKTVPRRGYRFTGEAREIAADEIRLEKRTQTRTMIEFQEEQHSRRFAPTRVIAFSILLLAVAGGAVFLSAQYFSFKASDTRIESLAVIPFRTVGDQRPGERAGSGLADILTTRLSNVNGITVRSVGSTLSVTGQDGASAGAKLNVDAVLEGTIYYMNDRVRVTAQLVRTRDASIVWSGEFDKRKGDELQLQNDLARQIVPLLAANLSSEDRDAVSKVYTQNSDAYELYLQGRYEWNKRSTEGMREAQRLFRNAIEADPSFALAYVGLADMLNTSQPDAHEAGYVIAKALELDPNLAEAHATRGFHLMFYYWDWNGAEASFRRSIELNNNYATAHHWYATLLAIKGDMTAAKVEMNRAVELDPLSHNFLADLGQLHYFAGEYGEAENLCNKALEIYPEFPLAHEYLHYIYLKTGRYEQAVMEIARADDIHSSFGRAGARKPSAIEEYLKTYRESGGIHGYFEKRYPPNPTDPSSFYLYARKHAFAGENTQALDFLERSSNGRMFLAAFVKADPVFEGLRSEPRYQALLQKMGLS